jgi:hypothetical protein
MYESLSPSGYRGREGERERERGGRETERERSKGGAAAGKGVTFIIIKRRNR